MMTMCGRYVIDVTDDLSGIKTIIEEAQRRAQEMENSARGKGYPLVKTGEIFPGDTAAVLLPSALDQPESLLSAYPMTWGYPGFAKSKSSRIFNARIEQAVQKPIWRDSILTRRCIVPSNGFYEWKKSDSAAKAKKQKCLIRLKEQPMLYMAGIYRNLSARELDESGYEVPRACFSILTTQPNRLISEIHDRMPVVLLQSELDQWLYGDWESLANRDELELELRPVA